MYTYKILSFLLYHISFTKTKFLLYTFYIITISPPLKKKKKDGIMVAIWDIPYRKV